MNIQFTIAMYNRYVPSFDIVNICVPVLVKTLRNQITPEEIHVVIKYYMFFFYCDILCVCKINSHKNVHTYIAES